MANLLLEREIQIRQAEQKEAVRKGVSEAESEHSRRIPENYKKLISSEAGQHTQALYENAGNFAADVTEYVPARSAPETEVPSAAQRFADYKPVSATPATKRHMLFEGLSYKDGELLGENKPVDTATAVSVVPAVTPADDIDEEDALPTRRTMNTLKQVSAQRAETEENAQVGISYMLSSKAKVVLAAIALVIVAALAIICVNTGILNTLDAQIAEVQAVNAELQMNEEAVRTAIEEVMSQENIVEWALSQGMQVAP